MSEAGTYDHINPSHYQFKNGLELIDLTENLDFCTANVVKYAVRAGTKPDQPKLRDLQKSLWYLQRLIANEEERLRKEALQGKLVNNEASSYTEPNNY